MGSGPKAAEYLARDWSCFDRADRSRWRLLAEAKGNAAVYEVADALRNEVLAHCSAWPSDEERARDAAHHLRMIEIMSRVPARGR